MHLYLYHHVGLHKRHAPMIYTWLFNKECSDITITAKRIKALFILLADKLKRKREGIEGERDRNRDSYSKKGLLHSINW